MYLKEIFNVKNFDEEHQYCVPPDWGVGGVPPPCFCTMIDENVFDDPTKYTWNTIRLVAYNCKCYNPISAPNIQCVEPLCHCAVCKEYNSGDGCCNKYPNITDNGRKMKCDDFRMI